MTEDKQIEFSKLYELKSKLNNDLSQLYNKDCQFNLCNCYGYSFMYNIPLNCSNLEHINSELKELVIKMIKLELDKIETQLKQF